MISVREILTRLADGPPAVVGLSGGVDSTVLTVLGHMALGDRLLAVTAESATFPRRERRRVEELVGRYGFRHRFLPTEEMQRPEFVENGRERCYHCKRIRFSALVLLARAEGFQEVWDGSHREDDRDFRPGRRALLELGVRSPLWEMGLGKTEIRQLARDLGLPNREEPPQACLASRVPYGTRLTEPLLGRIEAAEEVLCGYGFRVVRVRDHEGVARIEVGRDERERLLELADMIVPRLRALGFAFISLDLEGYRTGSLNGGVADS